MDTTSTGIIPAAQSDASRGETAYRLALGAGEGRGMRQDWNVALDHLREAAGFGLTSAQASLAALAGDWAMAARIAEGAEATADWAHLRRAVDVDAWTRTPRAKILLSSPRVAIVENLASPEVCDWLIARARPRLSPAAVYNPGTGGPTHEGVRTNSESPFLAKERDLIFCFVRHRIAVVTELPVNAMEVPVVLHYRPGQQFLPHVDFIDPANPALAKDIAERGQRVLTFLLCLNDDYEGGETEFPILAKRFKGRKGNALFFWNVVPSGQIDERTVHAGLPPTRGEKWMLSQWIRDRDWRAAL
jgi:prolyl 4-hydroxylase